MPLAGMLAPHIFLDCGVEDSGDRGRRLCMCVVPKKVDFTSLQR